MLSAFKSGLWGVRLAAAALRWEAAWCALTAVLPSFLCRPASSILINAAWLACSPFNMSNSLTDDLLHFSSLLFCLNLCSFVFFRTFQALSWFLFPPFLPSIGLISLLFLKFFPFLVLKLCTPLMFFSGYLHTQPGFKKSKVKKKKKKVRGWLESLSILPPRGSQGTLTPAHHSLPCCYCLEFWFYLVLKPSKSYLIFKVGAFLDSPTCLLVSRIHASVFFTLFFFLLTEPHSVVVVPTRASQRKNLPACVPHVPLPAFGQQCRGV